MFQATFMITPIHPSFRDHGKRAISSTMGTLPYGGEKKVRFLYVDAGDAHFQKRVIN